MDLSLPRTFAGVLAGLVLAAAALTAAVTTAPSAGALLTITVSSNADSGGGSLRDAFALANTLDDDVEIIIPADVGDITLTTGELLYTGGVGADETLTLTGGGNTITQTLDDARVINDTANTLFTMSGLTITGGDAGPAGAGGGIFVQGSATITDSTISGNEATGDAAAGIRVSNGPLLLVDSTISGNTALSAGGAFVNGTATIVNSTITGNTATVGNGGGLFVGSGQDARLIYSTVVANTAGNLGANVFLQGSGDLAAFGTVIAQPLGVGTNCSIGGVTTSAGYNWDDDGTCGFDQPTDHSDAGDPQLGALADNGGPTPTMLPAETSGLVGDIPAAACGDGDALAGFAVTTDQRGEPRPDVATGACDIGAVELQFPVPPDPPGPTPAPIVIEPTFTG